VTLMRNVEWGSCLLEPRRDPRFERRFRRETGRPSGAICYFAGSPWLEDTIVSLNVDASKQVAIESELAGLIGMVVSQDNSCRFCFAETRALLRILGMPERRISRLEHDLLTEEFDERERAALEFSRHFSRSNPPPDKPALDALRAAGFDELQITEIASVAASFVFFNRLTTIVALPPYAIEELPDRWYVKCCRPALAWLLRRASGTAPLVPLEPVEREGIFSRVVVGFDGLPFAHSLRKTLDGMWASPLLTRRAKAMVVAIVARALGCPQAEAEATELMRKEGLAAEPIEEILAHLHSAALDPEERVMASFARETVWYEPVRIQQLGRDAMQTLSREAFVELVAVASIANMICRLCTVAGPR